MTRSSSRAMVLICLVGPGCEVHGGWRYEDPDDDDLDSDWDDDDEETPGRTIPATAPAGLGPCAPAGGADWAALGELTETCDGSVHELVTCGGLQMSLSQGFVLSLVLSNGDIVVPEATAELALYGDDFERAADGSYRMPLSDDGNSVFAIRFYEEGASEPIPEDVFRLDSYLAGVRVDASLTFDEMRDNPSVPCRFAFRFDGPGPLAYLLNEGAPLQGSFVVDLTFAQVLAMVGWGSLDETVEPVDLGPFDSLLGALEVESDLTYVDDRGGAVVEYTATGVRQSVRQTVDDGAVPFAIPSIRASMGAWTLRAGASDIRYLRRGSLAGVLEFEGEGDGGMRFGRTSDFGEGSPYPESSWSCP